MKKSWPFHSRDDLLRIDVLKDVRCIRAEDGRYDEVIKYDAYIRYENKVLLKPMNGPFTADTAALAIRAASDYLAQREEE